MAPPASLPSRRLGKNGPLIPAIGFGMMGLSIAYGPGGSDEDRLALLDRAWELGETNWDSSDVYGDSEDLLGKWFALHPERRADIFLATKFGITGRVAEDGTLELGTNTSPQYVREAVERSLKRLGIDSIDLYYIHRLDAVTPVEKTMEALAELKREGKIKAIGISECSAAALRRASKIAPVDAVQVEYNPWQLDIEAKAGEGSPGAGVLDTCREIGATVFAYSPLGRGFLTGQIRTVDDFDASDFRRQIPRFSPENFPKNLQLVDKFQTIAARKGCQAGQLALAWLLAQGDDIIPIPGTKSVKRLEENIASVKVVVTAEEQKEIRALIESIAVVGERQPVGGFFDMYADSAEL